MFSPCEGSCALSLRHIPVSTDVNWDIRNCALMLTKRAPPLSSMQGESLTLSNEDMYGERSGQGFIARMGAFSWTQPAAARLRLTGARYWQVRRPRCASIYSLSLCGTIDTAHAINKCAASSNWHQNIPLRISKSQGQQQKVHTIA